MFRNLALCLITALLLSACRGLESSIYVDESPPAPPLIVRPVCPGYDYEWVSGRYTYVGETWVWSRGAWVSRPRPGAYWVPGRW